MSKSYQFGFMSLIGIVVGNAVGAGIYTTSGFALEALGSVNWVLLAWLVAGFVAISGAISYGMLVQQIAESGGEFLFLTHSIHPLAGFVGGWVSILAGFPGAVAFSASVLALYCVSLFPMFNAQMIAIFVTILCGFIHWVKIAFGAKIHQWLVYVMLVLLCCMIFAGLWVESSQLTELSVWPRTTFSWFAFANTLVWISLSYSGFNAAVYIADEVGIAPKRIASAMIWGTIITTIICVLVNTVFLYSTQISQLSAKADIALIAADALGGSYARMAMQWLVVFSLFTSLTAMMLAGPRVYAKMADYGALPYFFAMKKSQAPRSAIALQTGISVVLLCVSDLRDLLSYLGLALSLCLALSVASLFVRHWRVGQKPASAFYPVAPLLFVIATSGFAILSAINDYRQLIALLPVLFCSIVAYYFSQRCVNGPKVDNANIDI